MRFRKKPIVIDAVQFEGGMPSVVRIVEELKIPEDIYIYNFENGNNGKFYIHTLEGTHIANIDDWIVKGVKGEFYPVKPDIFEQTYQSDKEWTKGASIPCRDCGEILSILTTESAKILDARCPKCHKEFQKKGEEFNLEIGYTRQVDALSPLALSSLADNGSFGLEKWLLGIKNEKAKELLRDGIAFCDYLINQEWDGIAFNKSEKGSTSDIAKDRAWNIKKRIMELIGKDVPDSPLAEPEARAMQAFFNSESVPMLRSVLAQQLSRERRRKL